MAPQLDPLPTRGVRPPIGMFPKANTLTTGNGPIAWTQSPDGSIQAQATGRR